MRKKNNTILQNLRDTSLDMNLRVTMILALAGAVGNTLGFVANDLLYGMTVPTMVCAVCDVLILLTLLLGLRSRYYRFFGILMLNMLNVLEFPLLVMTYGAVMVPYLIIGFLGTLMLTGKKSRLVHCTLLALYDVAVIVGSTIHPYIFGPQETAGLLGSAIITFLIALGTLTACVMLWQDVAVQEAGGIDSVTGCYNRNGFLTNVGRRLARDEEKKYTILVFNIHSFKAINTVCGTEGGNRLLQELAQRIRCSPLAPLCLCRFSGDRFCALVETRVFDEAKLEELCTFRFQDKGQSLEVELSCGVYHMGKEEAELDTLCDRASAACRLARSGKERHYRIYDEAIAERYRVENELLGELEWAMEQRSFEPCYHPIVDCKTQQVCFAEALARWNHPRLGMISPGIFVPILEEKGFVTRLDTIMAQRVDEFLQSRQAEGKPAVPVSVNLSRVDLFDGEFMNRLCRMVAASRAEYYRFELTESAYEELPPETMERLAELRRCGAKILMDDFGKGYSSLGAVTDCEFDLIKLDMSFTAKLETDDRARSVVASLIRMSHDLGARVVAEGVETRQQLEYLCSVDCDYVQGYLFHKPMSEAAFAALLDSQ